MRVREEGDSLLFYGMKNEDVQGVFYRYLDLGRNYREITNRYNGDKYLSEAVRACPGIRILRQESWEALCSFIISQNNNIPRIKGIIKRLCESFGEELESGMFTFPSPEVLSGKAPEDLASLRAGFRAKYIIDAANKVSSGEIDFDKIAASPIEFGRQELQKIKGVGKKVAECTLLYGFGKYEAFPEDVWVKRIMAEMYPDGLPACTKGSEGIAQQYLFHWRRTVYRENL
jgi:N-glycosylase/DNA lyase